MAPRGKRVIYVCRLFSPISLFPDKKVFILTHTNVIRTFSPPFLSFPPTINIVSPFLSLFKFKFSHFTNQFRFSLYFSPFFSQFFFECMIESGFVFTQISTTKSGSSHERTRKCKKSSKKTRVWIVFFWRFVQVSVLPCCTIVFLFFLCYTFVLLLLR
ncbi:hypothetical protein LINGRAHAP2_LOCUS19295 [Linum grandiflorum]